MDWAAVPHAYGAASDVPALLAALRSPHAAERATARGDLSNKLRHQGTLYPAAAVTAPFLLELAADPELPERHEIVALLAHLAVGYDEEWLPETIPIARIRRRLPPARSSSRTAGLAGWRWMEQADASQLWWQRMRLASRRLPSLGPPDRGRSTSPAVPWWLNRPIQRRTVRGWQPSSSAMAVADQPCSDNSSITARVATRHWPCSNASSSGRAWSGRLGVDGGGAQTGPASCGRCGRWPTRLLGSRTQLTIHYGQHFWSQA